MTVAARIGTGFGLLLALLAVAVAYHATLMRALLEDHRNLSTSALPAALHATELERLIGEQVETTRKLFALGDTGYADKLEDLSKDFGTRLGELVALDTQDAVRSEIERLAVGWRATSPTVARASLVALDPAAREDPDPARETARSTALDPARETSRNVTLDPARETSRGVALDPVLATSQGVALDRLQALAAQASAVRRTAERSVREQRAQVARTGERTARIDLLLLATALIASVAIAAFTTRSITRPLKRLVEATHAVAAGRFDQRLPPGDDELGRVAVAFNAMSRQLAAVERLKRELIARAAHDLRTPLVAMAETASVLLAEIPGPLGDRQRRMVELNRQGAGRLLRRIESLLDLSRLDDGTFTLELAHHDLVALTHTVLGELSGRARRRRIRLVATLPPAPLTARCDGDRVARVLENLLDNAIRLTSAEGRIVVELATLAEPPPELPEHWRARLADAPAGGWARFVVDDQGPGLAEADRERVFGTVYRPVDGETESPRTGLGLAICRDIVTAHRGAIWVEDAEDGGSRFHVLLPRRHPSPEVPT